MLFEIEHVTRYAFDAPVFLEPHTIRLRPRNDPSQCVRKFQLTVIPEPAGVSDSLDAEGNSVVHCWFNGPHDELTISVRCLAETFRENPFDFLRSNHKLPMQYGEQLDSVLAAYRRPADESVRNFAQRLCAESDGEVLPFLTRLCETLHGEFEISVRHDGLPWPAAETLHKQAGACRDVAMLYVEACRSVGLAARFVSGYQEGDPDQSDRDLHAWAEVYLPHGGWRGFDPTHGLAVADGHIAVAASSSPELAAPVTGTFRGTGVSSQVSFSLHIEASKPLYPPQMQQQ